MQPPDRFATIARFRFPADGIPSALVWAKVILQADQARRCRIDLNICHFVQIHYEFHEGRYQAGSANLRGDRAMRKPVRKHWRESMPPVSFPADQVHAGLAELLKARECSLDTKSDLWEFSISLQTLRGLGLSETYLRWLVRRGYIEHRFDLTAVDDEKPRFRSTSLVRFLQVSCFVMTSAGEDYARPICRTFGQLAHSNSPVHKAARFGIKDDSESPYWNANSRQLKFRGRIALQVHRPAPNLRAVLDALEAGNWAAVTHVTLPADGDSNSKSRLHNAINALNRLQRVPMIHFAGDGSGMGVEWHPVLQSTQKSGRRNGRRGSGTRRSAKVRTRGTTVSTNVGKDRSKSIAAKRIRK